MIMINQILNKSSLITLVTLLSIALLLVTTACAGDNNHNLENNIGLYELVEKKCYVEKNTFNPCASTYFFELVKGQFFGIKDSELAYVFWSGDPKIDPELQYTAQLIKNHITAQLTDNKIWLNNDNETYEYLGFSGGSLSHYYVKYINDKGVERTIEYTLKPVRRGSLPLFRLNYPGNK